MYYHDSQNCKEISSIYTNVSSGSYGHKLHVTKGGKPVECIENQGDQPNIIFKTERKRDEKALQKHL